LPKLYLLLFLVPVFLFPVAVYCWALAMVNRRLRPLVVPGPWDLVGLLFAVSGFLLVAGPFILSGLYYEALREMPPGHGRSLAAVLAELLLNEWVLLLVYYGLVVAGALLLLRIRRAKTIVYNVDPAELEGVLTRCLIRLGLYWTRQGKQFIVTAAAPEPVEGVPEAAKDKLTTKVLPLFPSAASAEAESAVVDLEPFSAMYHVTLNWRAAGGSLRDTIETDLRRALAEIQTPDNPAAAWLLGAAGCLFGLMFFSILVLILGGLLGRN